MPGTPTGWASHSRWICGLVLGAVIERLIIRPVEEQADINAVILTLGLFIMLRYNSLGDLGQPLPVLPGSLRRPRHRDKGARP